MYTKPQMQRFGSFRDLTRVGFDSDGDGGFLGLANVANGCNLIDRGDCGS